MADRTVTIKFIGETRDAEGKITGLEGKVGGLDTKLGGIAKTAAGFAVGAGLTQLPGILLDGAKGAAEDQLAMDRLKQAVTNTGKSYDDMAPAIDEAIKRGQELAFTDGETATALGTLTSLTGDSDEAMRRLGPAMDLARGAGISLEEAAKLLGKTSDENTSALSRLGIQVGENATAQDVLNAVDQKFQGQAGVYAASSAGQLAIAQQQAGELAETFGGALIPVIGLVTTGMLAIVDAINTYVVPAFNAIITAITPVITTIGGFIADNIGPIVAGLTGVGIAIMTILIPAFVAWVAGMIPVIAAHVTLAAATLAAYAPIIAIVAAVGIAVALLYKAWSENLFGIQDITKQVWDFVRPYIETAIGAIQTVFETVFPIIQTVVETVFGVIRTVVETYVAAWTLIIQTALGIIQSVFETVFPILQTVVETAFSLISTYVTTYIGIVQSVIETAIGVIQAIWDPFWNGLQVVVETVMPIVQTAVETATSAIQTAIDTVIAGINLVWGPFWDGIKSTVDNALNLAGGAVELVQTGVDNVKGAIDGAKQGIIDSWNAIWDPVKETIRGVKTVVEGIVNDIVGIVNGVISRINGAIGAINDALSFTVSIPGVDKGPIHIGGFDYTFDAPDIPTIPLIGGGGGAGAGGGGGTQQLSATSYSGGAASPMAAAFPTFAGNSGSYIEGDSAGFGEAGSVAGMRRVVLWITEGEAANLVNGSVTGQLALRRSFGGG